MTKQNDLRPMLTIEAIENISNLVSEAGSDPSTVYFSGFDIDAFNEMVSISKNAVIESENAKQIWEAVQEPVKPDKERQEAHKKAAQMFDCS